MAELASFAVAALICLWGTGAIWLASFSPRRSVECYDRRPQRTEVAERLATAPRFVYRVETRAIAEEGSYRPGMLDTTLQTHKMIDASD
jgi:hypothetical protein